MVSEVIYLAEFKTFFSYYGSKSRIVHHYPKPKYGTIIEPFCGSGSYSVQNFENNVFLNDLDDNIVDVWKWLIECSPVDILSLPKFTPNMDLRDLNLSRPEKIFCGFWANFGSRRPCHIVSKFASVNDHFESVKERVSKNLYRIKHFKVNLGSYKELTNNIKATWFIDPPYQKQGQIYRKRDVNYDELKIFCETRNGLCIVCDNEDGNYLPFLPLIKNPSPFTKTTEAIWIKENDTISTDN